MTLANNIRTRWAFMALFSFLLIIALNSCTSHKKWLNQGVKHGWIKDKNSDTSGTIVIDTVEVYSKSDTIIKEVLTVIQKPCDEKGNIKPEAKKQIADSLKKKLIPAIQEATLPPDRNIVLTNGGSLKIWIKDGLLHYALHNPAPQLICPEPTFKEACQKVWWAILLSFFLGIAALVTFLSLITRIIKT